MDRLIFRTIFQKIIFQSAVFVYCDFSSSFSIWSTTSFPQMKSLEVVITEIPRTPWQTCLLYTWRYPTISIRSYHFITMTSWLNSWLSIVDDNYRWQDRHGRDIIEQMTGACACDGASKRSVRPGQIHYSSYLWRPRHDKNRHPISQSKISHKLRVPWDQRLLDSAKYVTRVTRHFYRSAVNMYSTLHSWYVILQI